MTPRPAPPPRSTTPPGTQRGCYMLVLDGATDAAGTPPPPSMPSGERREIPFDTSNSAQYSGVTVISPGLLATSNNFLVVGEEGKQPETVPPLWYEVKQATGNWLLPTGMFPFVYLERLANPRALHDPGADALGGTDSAINPYLVVHA